MLTNLHHPAIEACLVPLLLAFGLSGAIRLGAGPERGRLAAIGMGFAVLISAVLILDRALWPPRSGLVKLPYILLGGLALGVIFDSKANRIRVPVFLACAWMALILGWLGWPQLARSATWWTLAGLYLSGLIMYLRVSRMSPTLPDIGIILSIGALGLAGVAVVSGSLMIGELSLALAAALLGFTLWRVAGAVVSFGATVVFCGLFGLLALGALTLLLTEASPLSVGVLVLIFFADQARRCLPHHLSGVAPPWVVLLVFAILPVAVAIGSALLTDGADSDYG